MVERGLGVVRIRKVGRELVHDNLVLDYVLSSLRVTEAPERRHRKGGGFRGGPYYYQNLGLKIKSSDQI